MSELLHVKHTHCRARDASRDREKKTVMRKAVLVLVCVHLVSVTAPVWWRGEETQDDVSSLHVDDVACGVQEVEVKV